MMSETQENQAPPREELKEQKAPKCAGGVVIALFLPGLSARWCDMEWRFAKAGAMSKVPVAMDVSSCSLAQL